ncbi:hypothetical protein, partial [Salinibacter ruber]|uniref:hypothetical protein n=1 Tax=Salinibacter ruber TaxID=146919 RepID=UPI0021699307
MSLDPLNVVLAPEVLAPVNVVEVPVALSVSLAFPPVPLLCALISKVPPSRSPARFVEAPVVLSRVLKLPFVRVVTAAELVEKSPASTVCPSVLTSRFFAIPRSLAVEFWILTSKVWSLSDPVWNVSPTELLLSPEEPPSINL